MLFVGEFRMGYKYKVSVCIPVYNSELFLVECIESLVTQTLKDIELIFVNDGSTDRSPFILKKYAKRFTNIKIVNQANTGLGGARNAGINSASGEYIGFVDSDDFVEPSMFETLYNSAKKNNVDIAMCGVRIYPSNITSKRCWYNPYEGKISAEFLNRNTQPWNKIVKSRLIKESSFKFYKENGDGVFILLMLKAKGIVSVNEKLYNYRAGHNSMSTNYKLNLFKQSYASNKEQMKLLSTTDYASTLRQYFEYRILYSIIQILTIAALNDNKNVYNEFVGELDRYNFRSNKYVRTMLPLEFSKIKLLGMTTILPNNYLASKLMMKTLRATKQI